MLIVYYSRSGNTKKMAAAIAEGAGNVQGVDVELKTYESPEKLVNFDAILVGAPTYHHSMTNNIKTFLEVIAFHDINLKGKIGAVFGSYGWSGEAPRLVQEVMKHKFEMNVIDSPLLIRYAPDTDGLERCKEFGKKNAEELLKAS